MTRTSRLRRLHVVEPSPHPAEPQEPPATDSEVPSPDSSQADLDAALAGMSLLLRVALRLMRSHDASQSPSRRERGR
jgi:hypothetical protein